MNKDDINAKVNNAIKDVNRQKFGQSWYDKKLEKHTFGPVMSTIFIVIFMLSIMAILFYPDIKIKILAITFIIVLVGVLIVQCKQFSKDLDKYEILKRMNKEIDYKKINVDATEFTICKFCGAKISIHEPNCSQCGAANDKFVKENVNDAYNSIHNTFEDMLEKESK